MYQIGSSSGDVGGEVGAGTSPDRVFRQAYRIRGQRETCRKDDSNTLGIREYGGDRTSSRSRVGELKHIAPRTLVGERATRCFEKYDISRNHEYAQVSDARITDKVEQWVVGDCRNRHSA